MFFKKTTYKKNVLVIILIYIFHKQDSAGINQSLRMEIRLQKRKARVQDYCKRYKRNADTVLGKDLLYFNVFRSRKVIYCFVPNVSSSQWKKEVSPLVENDKQIYKGSLKTDLSRFPPQEVEQMLKNYFAFLFVRDPIERVLSAYKDKIVKHNEYYHPVYGRDIIKRYRPNATKQALETCSAVSFPEFTKYAIRSCHPYQLVGRRAKPEPVRSSSLLRGPWQEISIDLDAISNDEHLLVVVDYYSGWLEAIP